MFYKHYLHQKDILRKTLQKNIPTDLIAYCKIR